MKNSPIRFYLVLVLLVTFLFIIPGCAKTVTGKTGEGNVMQINVLLRGNYNILNKYYIIIGYGRSPIFPYLASYFFGPGENYDKSQLFQGDLDYYYNYYFSTWQDYVVLTTGNFYVVNGPFTDSAKHFDYTLNFLDSRKTDSSDPDTNRKIQLNLYTSRLSFNPETFYFNIVTADQFGILSDSIDTNPTISNVIGATASGSDESSTTADPSLDINSWSVTIQ